MRRPRNSSTSDLKQATPISSAQSLTNRVSRSNRVDVFSLSLSDRTSFNLKCRSSGSGTSVQLVQDSNQNGLIDPGETLRRFTARSNKTTTVQILDLASGTYFIQVAIVRQGSSRYQLSLSPTLTGSNKSFNPVADISSTPSGASANEFAQRVIDLTNSYRRQSGLAVLAVNNKLNAVAQAYSQTMAAQDFMAHQGLDGSQPWDRMTAGGYQWSRAAENLAGGQETPEEVVQAWINSSGHRANLLNPELREIGVGYFYLANDTGNVNHHAYWAQNFGAPA